MSIYYNETARVFKLDSAESSYAFMINELGCLVHLYYGGRISDSELTCFARLPRRSCHNVNPAGADRSFSPDVFGSELSCTGTGDFRVSALSILDGDGHNTTDIKYLSHKMYKGKPPIAGLPATFAEDGEAETLELLTADAHTGAQVTLLYTVFEALGVTTRSVLIKNTGSRAFHLKRAFSSCVDFYNSDYDLLHLYGKWGDERNIEKAPLRHGIHTVSSTRGVSGHNHNPFVALMRKDAGEDFGEVYGFSLVYSGNFSIETEVDGFCYTRVIAGINPEGFSWLLEPGESFACPEVVMAYSGHGLGGMSRTLHRLYRDNLCKSIWNKRPRPVRLDTWEAALFDISEQKILDYARLCPRLGIELILIDDGWFDGRSSDAVSLGDWEPDPQKFPRGFSPLIKEASRHGVKLGIWFDPEMINENSRLYRAHPEWVLSIDGRGKSLGRSQYCLDMSRPDVRDYLFETICGVIDEGFVYLKWDFNRPLTEVGSSLFPPNRQGEISHRYILGVYELLDRICKKYPELEIEGCASGGGRFDPGIHYYVPHSWTSDNTDPFDRVFIQYGTSIAYPPAFMSAHVPSRENPSTGRRSSLEMSCAVSLCGCFGFELDILSMSEEEIAVAYAFSQTYKRHASLIINGDLYRLINPFEDSGRAAWMVVSRDKSEALMVFTVLRSHIHQTDFVRLKGLDPQKKYIDGVSRRVLSGDTLMNAGINLSAKHRDGDCIIRYFSEVLKGE